MLPEPLTAHAAALDLQQHQGLDRLLRFFDLGGTITPPSDDPQDWWEPENLTHRAALSGWIAVATKIPNRGP